MALTVWNAEVEQLASHVALALGITKTEAVRQALLKKYARLGLLSPEDQWRALKPTFERDVWSRINPAVLGKGISQEEQDDILGYGPDGC